MGTSAKQTLAARNLAARLERKKQAPAAGRRRTVERALTKLYRVLGLTDAMTKAEVVTEAYYAFKRGLITKRQARVLGCVLR